MKVKEGESKRRKHIPFTIVYSKTQAETVYVRVIKITTRIKICMLLKTGRNTKYKAKDNI